MAPTAALDGVRVRDFASVGPAARASRMLSDYGADVVKLGPMPRDGGVQIVPPYYAYSGHRLMQRALLDLKADEGRDAFLALARDADVVLESFRPGVMDRLGIGYDTVREVNPRIVYCSTSGFGQSGPKSTWAGHDLNYLALSGYLDCSSPRGDGRPPLPGATVADIAAGGMQATMAIMAGLLRRERTGEGEHLDVSIADGAFGLMSLYVDEYLATGTEPGPGHYILTGRYACYDTYACADGGHLSVGAIEPQFWRNLCRELDLEHYADVQMDDDRQDEIRTAVAGVLATRTRDEWTEQLGPADCCVAPVLTVAEAIDDPQFVARGMVVDADHATEGAFRQTGPVWAGTSKPDGAYPVREGTTTDTEDLLAAAGYDADRITELIDAGVVA
jgi:alpha-methylacyl-CoA racemase